MARGPGRPVLHVIQFFEIIAIRSTNHTATAIHSGYYNMDGLSYGALGECDIILYGFEYSSAVVTTPQHHKSLGFFNRNSLDPLCSITIVYPADMIHTNANALIKI